MTGSRELRVNGGWLLGLKLLIILIPMGIAAQVAFGAWCVTQITDVRLQVARIEATQFKTMDGLEIWQAIGVIRSDMTALERRHGRRDGS